MSREQLDAMVEEATVDCYDEADATSGFPNLIEERLAVPFETRVLGADVSADGADLADDDQIVAVCSRGRSRQAVPLLELPLPELAPKDAEWVEACRFWAAGAQGV